MEGEAVSTQILEHGFVLPLSGSKAYSGFVVNLSTGDIRLRDAAVLTNVGNRLLFSQALFAMAQTRTTKEAVQVVTEMIEQAAPPDMTEQVDGVTYHYPGVFQDQINFTQWQNYDYLQNLAGLSPVSTADGRNWFIPTYYSAQDPEVIAGEAAMGQIKPTGQYIKDSALFYANLPVSQLEKAMAAMYTWIFGWFLREGTTNCGFPLGIILTTPEAFSLDCPVWKRQRTVTICTMAAIGWQPALVSDF